MIESRCVWHFVHEPCFARDNDFAIFWIAHRFRESIVFVARVDFIKNRSVNWRVLWKFIKVADADHEKFIILHVKNDLDMMPTDFPI